MLIDNLIKSFNVFSDEETQKIQKYFVPITFETHSFLVEKGKVSDKIFFITEGLIREFSFSDVDVDLDLEEKTTTHWILSENEWIYQVESYILEKPSESYIQALSKVKAYYLLKNDLAVLLHEIPRLSLVMLGIYERYLLQLEHRNAFHRIKSAKKRIEVFEKMQPNIQNRVKGKFLASYLNISPQQLSRIRSERANKV
jgi:CRP-like cAMP-binding protein